MIKWLQCSLLIAHLPPSTSALLMKSMVQPIKECKMKMKKKKKKGWKRLQAKFQWINKTDSAMSKYLFVCLYRYISVSVIEIVTKSLCFFVCFSSSFRLILPHFNITNVLDNAIFNLIPHNTFSLYSLLFFSLFASFRFFFLFFSFWLGAL